MLIDPVRNFLEHQQGHEFRVKPEVHACHLVAQLLCSKTAAANGARVGIGGHDR
jgi:hypothetical protein